MSYTRLAIPLRGIHPGDKDRTKGHKECSVRTLVQVPSIHVNSHVQPERVCNCREVQTGDPLANPVVNSRASERPYFKKLRWIFAMGSS